MYQLFYLSKLQSYDHSIKVKTIGLKKKKEILNCDELKKIISAVLHITLTDTRFKIDKMNYRYTIKIVEKKN